MARMINTVKQRTLVKKKVFTTTQVVEVRFKEACACESCLSQQTRCDKCDQPQNKGRKLFTTKNADDMRQYLCGDCVADGVALEDQDLTPKRAPEPEHNGAWSTPCEEGVGSI